MLHTKFSQFLHRPIYLFTHREIGSGLIMLVAAATALIWANSAWGDSYHDFWAIDIDLTIGSWQLHALTVEEFVNEALMALFFFVVGLEIKRELVTGELRTLKAAALPAIGAVGGMVFPALIYLSLNSTGEASNGWGIPIATDIAFAAGIVALLGTKVNPLLKLFLLTLAIVDDIGAIVVIALFYNDDLKLKWVLVAVGALLVIRLAKALGVWSTPFYVVIGIVVWYAALESGVHATIAGVILGLMTPAKPKITMQAAAGAVLSLNHDATEHDISMAAYLMDEARPETEKLEHHLHPFTAFLVVPFFALANAGIGISTESLSSAATSRVTYGIVLGLLVGKPLGIVLSTWIATKLGLSLPTGVRWSEFAGIGIAAGIGFTVSIFVTNLAFTDAPLLTEQAKIGVLIASALASIATVVVFVLEHRAKTNKLQ